MSSNDGYEWYLRLKKVIPYVGRLIHHRIQKGQIPENFDKQVNTAGKVER